MLPPNTPSSLLPWSVVVPAMQVNGCFPYKMSAKTGAPVFSLYLFLWAIIMQFLMMILFILAFDTNFLVYLSYDVGTATYVVTLGFFMSVLGVSPILLGVRSRLLANLLHEMSTITCFPPLPAQHWYNAKTLALISMLVAFSSFALWFGCARLGFTSILGIITVIPACINCGASFMMPQEVSSMVFDLLACRLVAATEDTVAKVSTLLAPNGSFKDESFEKAALRALRDLDDVFRQVEVQREKGTRCFFPVVTLYMLMALLLAITSPYTLLQGTLMGGTTILTEVVAVCIMIRFSHLGQSFVNKVSAAEGLLKELRVNCESPVLNQKVSQVMGSLSPLLAFDLRGWYRLDYASFLTMVNTVLTYEAIILQVGGTAITKASSAAESKGSTMAYGDGF